MFKNKGQDELTAHIDELTAYIEVNATNPDYKITDVKESIYNCIALFHEIEKNAQLASILIIDFPKNTLQMGLYSFLMQAMHFDKEMVVKSLIARDDIKEFTFRQEFSLKLWRMAFRKKHLDVIEALLGRDKDNLNLADDKGARPLHMASNYGHSDIVGKLLAMGVDVNPEMPSGSTPFSIACELGHLEVVNTLLADDKTIVNLANERGETPLHAACQKDNPDVVKALLANDQTNVNHANKRGDTPLHYACYEGHFEVVKILLATHGIDVKLADEDGITALHAACHQGNPDVVNALLANDKTNVNHANKRGDTPLHLACSQGHFEVVKILLATNGIDLNLADENGNTALHRAIQLGDRKMIELLKGANAGSDVQGGTGNTALTMCIEDKRSIEQQLGGLRL